MDLKKILKDGEEVIVQSKTTNKSLLVQLGVGVIPLVPAILLFMKLNPYAIRNGLIFLAFSLYIMISAVIRMLINSSTTIVVTNKRVLTEKGVSTVTTAEIPNEDIGAVTLSDPFFGSIFKYKTIKIDTKTGINNFRAKYVQNADELKEAIEKAKG